MYFPVLHQAQEHHDYPLSMEKVCDYDQWSVSDYVSRITRSEVSLPKFQRGITWGDERRKNLISSVRRGFPIGSILLARSENSSGNVDRFQIIDGLQRTIAIKRYLESPTRFVGVSDLQSDWKDTARWMVSTLTDSNVEEAAIEELLIRFISESDIQNLQSLRLFQIFKSCFDAPGLDEIAGNTELQERTDGFFKSLRDNLNINEVSIPVILYKGDRALLPEIFERLNSQGVALSKYQIYAATWDKECIVSDRQVVESISEFYKKRLDDTSLEINDVDDEGSPNEITLFDYLTGLGTVLVKRFPILFDSSWADKIAFQIANMGHKQSPADMPFLQSHFGDGVDGKIKTDAFTSAVIAICEEVNRALRGRLSLKLNSTRTAEFSGHSAFQIATLVTRLLVEDYEVKTWRLLDRSVNRTQRAQMIRRWYLIDRIRNAWGNAGDSQSFRQVWTTNDQNELVPNGETMRKNTIEELKRALDLWFDDELNRKERKRSSVNRDTKLVLRYFYYSKLSVQDENEFVFHLDHLVPVSWWKAFFARYSEEVGGPINSIGNLCLMIDDDNASKVGKLPYPWYQARSVEVPDFGERCIRHYFLLDDPTALEYPKFAETLTQDGQGSRSVLEAVQHGLESTARSRWNVIKSEILSKLAD